MPKKTKKPKDIGHLHEMLGQITAALETVSPALMELHEDAKKLSEKATGTEFSEAATQIANTSFEGATATKDIHINMQNVHKSIGPFVSIIDLLKDISELKRDARDIAGLLEEQRALRPKSDDLRDRITNALAAARRLHKFAIRMKKAMNPPVKKKKRSKKKASKKG